MDIVNILLGPLVGTVFATFFAFVGTQINSIADKIQLGKFRRAFGSGLTDSDQVSLVMSGIYPTPDQNGDISLKKIGRDGKLRLIQKADEFRLVADGDLICASQIMSLLSKSLKGTPKIFFDDERLAFQTQSTIFIGAGISNMKVEGILQQRRRLKEKERAFDIIAVSGLAEEQIIKDYVNNQEYALSDHSEYAIVARMRHDRDAGGYFYVYIVAGQTKFGTEAAGHYLYQNWQKFSGYSKTTPDSETQAIILETGRRLPGGSRVVGEIIA